MKKIVLSVMTVALLLTFQPLMASDSKTPVPAEMTVPIPENSKEVAELLLRLDEINAMDKSELNASEKRELRKEVRIIKAEVSSLGGGIYMSAGTLLLIIILLIILL